jgi:ribose transport system substrate-binding protein
MVRMARLARLCRAPQKLKWEDSIMRRRANLLRLAILTSFVGLVLGTTGTPGLGAMPATPTKAEQAAVMAKVPAAARQYYGHYWYYSPIFGDPYANWTPPPPPWQVCDNDSFLASSWRADELDVIKKLNEQYHKAGLTKATVLVTNSNNNIDLQLTQLSNLVREGCNIIISTPGSPLGLCNGMANALHHGVLIVTVQSSVDCDDAINVGTNQYQNGKQLAVWVGHALHGRGNVLILSGVPGISTTVALGAGSKAGYAEFPDIHLVGTVYGFWRAGRAKGQMVKWLATHPGRLDGIVSYGSMGTAAEEALTQSGRPLVKQADGTDECSYIAYWHDKGLHSLALSAGGGSNGYEAFYVAMKMMFGQKPTVNTIWYPLPQITDSVAANLYKIYHPTVTSTCWADPPDRHLVADAYIDQFFMGGKKVEPRPNPQ